MAEFEARHLGEEFPLFRENRLSEQKDDQLPLYTSGIALRTNYFPTDLPFSIQTFALQKLGRHEVLAPFDPGVGYTITDEDYNPEERAAKILTYSNAPYEYWKGIQAKFAPYTLGIGVTDNPTPECDWYLEQDSQGDGTFKPEILTLLKRLRIMISFPNNIYVGRLGVAALNNGHIDFAHYYPIESVPSLIPKEDYAEHGYALNLPADPEKLLIPTGRIILLNHHSPL